jgi:hypothetical protein
MPETNRLARQDGSQGNEHQSFPDDMFDLVTAIESRCFWPDLVNDMREILTTQTAAGQVTAAK